MQLDMEQSGAVQPDEASTAIDAYLAQHETKDLLRFLTCGSVDDGKSTLLGRLLYDTKLIFDDQLAALEGDSRRHGTQNGELDFALLVDGLSAEREQGITIDVAYRFFSTDQRKFIVADCPGHEQYTRNMATGASTAELAVMLVDARTGLLTQTRRHTWICSLLGIRHVLLAVNKMDLVDYAEATYRAIEAEYRDLAAQMGIDQVTAIPLSALMGDNVSRHSEAMPWYRGPTMLAYLESAEIEHPASRLGFRLPVQWVCRPDSSFRGYAGQVAAGAVSPGDEVVVLPSGARSHVARIVTADGDLERAHAGDAITLTLDDERDISRGDVIAATAQPPQVADQFAAHILWLDDGALLPGRLYRMKIGTRSVGAQITEIKHKVDVNTQDHLAAKRLELNEVGY
jgi:bifunctional enzyme CysN/CysC